MNERALQNNNVMDTIDAALHELGMLGSVTNARIQYLQEIGKYSQIVQKNSRYVTNVSFGFRIKPACDNNRVKPYTIGKKDQHGAHHGANIREERPRTRSENADAPPITNGLSEINPIIETVIDTTIDFAKCRNKNSNFSRPSEMKKSKSLENVRTENDNASQPSHEMEFVSSRIQRLKMND